MQAEQGEEKELQLLGNSWVAKESYEIILRWRKIFCQITVTLIFPLSVIILSHGYVSSNLFRRLLPGYPNSWTFEDGLMLFGTFTGEIRRGWILYWVFKAVYLVSSLDFSLLSTSAVVYAVASAYTGKEAAFWKVISLMPKVWKRLLANLLWSFWMLSVYNLVMVGILILSTEMTAILPSLLVIAITAVVAIFYWLVFACIAMIWQMANVVSVLEDAIGRQALIKSTALLEGKIRTASRNLHLPVLTVVILRDSFDYFAVIGMDIPAALRIMGGISCFIAMVMVILFCLVFQTVVYFICKSYHHEIIDKSALACHLEGYAGHYAPLAATMDVELQQVSDKSL